VSAVVEVDVHLVEDDRAAAMAADVREGLTRSPKSLPPVWFYDERGSELFDQITRLPEYYPTRAEHSILVERSDEIARRTMATTLVELGSGTSEKTRLLLDALTGRGDLERFVPLDVSEEVLRSSADDICDEYDLPVHAVVGDFHQHLTDLPRDGRRLVAFLGGTIGNFTPVERRKFFMDLDVAMDSDEWLLLGTDLVKDVDRLVAAYDDAQGVTAEFNRNVLHVIDNELGGDFDPDAFDHVARWNAEESWIEMRLRARGAQHVTIADLGLEVDFADGEEVLTEISAKFTEDRIRQELWDGGFVVEAAWTDPAGDFLLTLSHPYC
jgi:L-histidine N-alpha-methyltransferase